MTPEQIATEIDLGQIVVAFMAVIVFAAWVGVQFGKWWDRRKR